MWVFNAHTQTHIFEKRKILNSKWSVFQCQRYGGRPKEQRSACMHLLYTTSTNIYWIGKWSMFKIEHHCTCTRINRNHWCKNWMEVEYQIKLYGFENLFICKFFSFSSISAIQKYWAYKKYIRKWNNFIPELEHKNLPAFHKISHYTIIIKQEEIPRKESFQ